MALFNACTEAGLFCRDCVKTRIFGERWWLGKRGDDQSAGEVQAAGRSRGNTGGLLPGQAAGLTDSTRELFGGVRKHNPNPRSLEEVQAEERLQQEEEAQAARDLEEAKKQPGLVVMVSLGTLLVLPTLPRLHTHTHTCIQLTLHHPQILRMLGTLVVLVGIGTVFFMSAEGLTFVDACYMSTATIATVGYGDISPMTQSGRVFAIFWIMSGYSILVRSLHHLLDTNHTQTLERKRAKLLNRDLSRTSILNMDKDGDGSLSRLEFVTHMIVALKLCTPLHLRKIMERFDEIEESRIARDRVMKVMDDRTRPFVARADGGTAPPALIPSEGARTPSAQTTAPVELSPDEWARSVRRTSSPGRGIGTGIAVRRTGSLIAREALVQRQQSKMAEDVALAQGQAEQTEAAVDAAAAGGASKTAGKSVVIDVASGSGGRPVFDRLNNAGEKGGQEVGEGDEAGSESPSINSDVSNGNSNSRTTAIVVADDRDAAALYEREHPLSAMLAHLRRASELAREHVHAEARRGNIREAKAAVRCYRHLLESLHAQQAYALDRLEEDDPERQRCSPQRERWLQPTT